MTVGVAAGAFWVGKSELQKGKKGLTAQVEAVLAHIDIVRTVLPFEPNAQQWEALHRMIHKRIFVLLGLPGSGKTEMTCAAVLYLMFVFGETVLLLTETNIGAGDTRNMLARMIQLLEKEYPGEINKARGKMRQKVGPKSTYRWVTHSLANGREFEDEDSKTDRVSQSKSRHLCQVSRIVVSTLGHARSKAIQLFKADTIVIDEAARSPTPRILGTLLERWLNTSPCTTRIKPDEEEDGSKTKLWNAHSSWNLILVGDPVQGLPRLLGVPITDKKVAWDIGENDNMMTILMNCGADFVRLDRSFRTPHYGAQPILDRYYNTRVGIYADAATEVLAVKDAPVELVAQNELPLVEGKWLRCKGLRALLAVDECRRKYDLSDNDANLRLRHVILRTNPVQRGQRLSFANKLGSQVNWWHQRLIRDILCALFKDGELVDPTTGRSEKVSAKDILIMAPYNGQVNQIRAKLRGWFPERNDLHKLKVLTMEQVQGLQRPIIITDYTKDRQSAFLLGHHKDVFQAHHNKHYSVGLTRAQGVHFSIACVWPIDRTSNEYARRNGVVREQVEESYMRWERLPSNHPLTQRFRMPGDRIPLWHLDPSKPPEPFVDATNDNLWYFLVYSEKFYDHYRKVWTFKDAFHWQRGVGCVYMPPPAHFQTVPRSCASSLL